MSCDHTKDLHIPKKDVLFIFLSSGKCYSIICWHIKFSADTLYLIPTKIIITDIFF